jgi:hypothetical protein
MFEAQCYVVLICRWSEECGCKINDFTITHSLNRGNIRRTVVGRREPIPTTGVEKIETRETDEPFR